MADVCVAEKGDYKCKQDESEDPLSEFRCMRPGLRNVGNHQTLWQLERTLASGLYDHSR